MRDNLIQALASYSEELERKLAQMEKRIAELEQQLHENTKEDEGLANRIDHIETLLTTMTQQVNKMQVDYVASGKEMEMKAVEEKPVVEAPVVEMPVAEPAKPVEAELFAPEVPVLHEMEPVVIADNDIIPIADMPDLAPVAIEVAEVVEPVVAAPVAASAPVPVQPAQPAQPVTPAIPAIPVQTAPVQPVEPVQTAPVQPVQSNISISNGSNVSDIRQAISLGDRFLFQRELFNQSGERMQKTLDVLNRMPNFEEAVNYLDQNFKWDHESTAYMLFINALRRRF